MKDNRINSVVKLLLAFSCLLLTVSILVFSLSSLTKAQAGDNKKEQKDYYQVTNPIGEYQFSTFTVAGVINVLVYKTSSARSRLYYFDGKGKLWKSWLENEQLPQIPLK